MIGDLKLELLFYVLDFRFCGEVWKTYFNLQNICWQHILDKKVSFRVLLFQKNQLKSKKCSSNPNFELRTQKLQVLSSKFARSSIKTLFLWWYFENWFLFVSEQEFWVLLQKQMMLDLFTCQVTNTKNTSTNLQVIFVLLMEKEWPQKNCYISHCSLIMCLSFVCWISLVVNSDTTLHSVNTRTVATCSTVTIKWCICYFPHSLTRTSPEWLIAWVASIHSDA